MTDEELKQKCKERAKIFQQAMESCHSLSPTDCIEWFADRIAELEAQKNWLEGCKSELGEHLGNANDRIADLEKEIAELKYQLNKNPCVKIPEWHCSDCLKENAELKEQNTNLQEMLKTERSVTCKEEYLKKVTELEQEIAELKDDNKVMADNYSKMEQKFYSNLTKAREIILKLYNAGRDVLMCRAEEKAYDNLDEAINDRSIEQFLKEVEK